MDTQLAGYSSPLASGAGCPSTPRNLRVVSYPMEEGLGLSTFAVCACACVCVCVCV